jgi:hypothetical protein
VFVVAAIENRVVRRSRKEIDHSTDKLIDLPEHFKCVAEKGISSPSRAQLTLNKSETNLTRILSTVALVSDMVYVVCMECSTLRVPHGLHNILLVDGRESDKCIPMDPEDASLLHKQTKLYHCDKVGFSHKAAVAHAASKNFANISIIEDDLIINPSMNELQFQEYLIRLAGQVQVHLAEKSHQLVRFTSLPWGAVTRDRPFQSCDHGLCVCQSLSSDFCSLPRGCSKIHDSSFYMMSNSMFREFLAPKDKCLDMEHFGTFDSILVTPPITLQKRFNVYDRKTEKVRDEHGPADQMRMWNKYKKNCVVPLGYHLDGRFKRGSWPAATSVLDVMVKGEN